MLIIEAGMSGLYYGFDPELPTCLFAGKNKSEVRARYEKAIDLYSAAYIEDEKAERGEPWTAIDMPHGIKGHIWAQNEQVGRPGHIPDIEPMTPDQQEETRNRIRAIWMNCMPTRGSA